jgi:hypothetical protein
MGSKKKAQLPSQCKFFSLRWVEKEQRRQRWTVLLFKYSLAEEPRELSLEKEAQMVRH